MSNYKIYGKDDCSYCHKAEVILKKNDLKYDYIKVGQDITIDDFKRKLNIDITERTTVPKIFYKGKLIGGYVALRESLR